MTGVATWYQDNWTWVVPTVIGLVATLSVGYWGVRAGRQTKQLDYSVAGTKILSTGAALVADSLSVSYSGQVVKAPYLLRIRMYNTGKRAIRRDDFIGLVEVTLGDATALVVSVSGTNIPQLDELDVVAYFKEEEERHAFDIECPPLLNSSEWFELQVMCSGSPKEVKARTRFADQTRPMKEIAGPAQPFAPKGILAYALLSLAALLVPVDLALPHGSASSAVLSFVSGILLGTALSLEMSRRRLSLMRGARLLEW